MDEDDHWQRIGDGQFAQFGRRMMQFTSADGPYIIEVDDVQQSYVVHQVAGVNSRWPVNLKELKGGVFRLSGPAYTPEAWYELTLSNPARIVYWPNEKIGRIDDEVSSA